MPDCVPHWESSLSILRAASFPRRQFPEGHSPRTKHSSESVSEILYDKLEIEVPPHELQLIKPGTEH